MFPDFNFVLSAGLREFSEPTRKGRCRDCHYPLSHRRLFQVTVDTRKTRCLSSSTKSLRLFPVHSPLSCGRLRRCGLRLREELRRGTRYLVEQGPLTFPLYTGLLLLSVTTLWTRRTTTVCGSSSPRFLVDHWNSPDESSRLTEARKTVGSTESWTLRRLLQFLCSSGETSSKGRPRGYGWDSGGFSRRSHQKIFLPSFQFSKRRIWKVDVGYLRVYFRF